MISKEKFTEYFKTENKMLSRDNLYVIYEFLLTLNNKLEEDYKFNIDRIKSYSFLLDEGLQKRIEELHEPYCHTNFWNMMINQDREVEKDRDKKMSTFFKERTGMQRDYCSLHHYMDIILCHLIPVNKQVIEIYCKKVEVYVKKMEDMLARKRSKNNKIITNNGGIYGIYENGELVYIGMTMRPFEDRWKEHQERIEKGSNELALYNLIDANAKIEFKKLLEVDKMDSNDKITKRDLQAMEFALIQEHRPKYNFAGRTQPYRF